MRLRNRNIDNDHVVHYPGTELPSSDEHNITADGKITLIPHPSNDPSDPLNWSRKWKWLTMISMALSTFNWVFSPLAMAPQVPFYMEEFDVTLPTVIELTGITILILGFTNMIWIPFCRGFGRRPMALITTLITTASCIWRAKATSYTSYLGAVVVCGIGASPGETLGPVLIADTVFVHERGRWMGVYQWSFMSALMIGPVVSGVSSERYGVASFWWIGTAISAFVNIWIAFFLPETEWDRRKTTPNTHLSTDSSSEGESAPDTKEKISSSHLENATTRTETPAIVVGKPNKRQLAPIVGWSSHEPIIGAITLPFKMLRFPIAIWGAFQFTFACSSFLMINLTQSQALAAAPYDFSPAIVGYTNIASFVGTSFALLTAGPLSDWLSNRSTLRNHGIREPEFRLPAMIPFAILMVIGCLISAIGFNSGWPWEAVVVVGFTFLGVQVAALSGIAINYVVDCYKPAAGEFLVGATVVKNVFGYAMSKFLNNWITEVGYVGPLLTIMALNCACLILAIPLYYFGKRLRGWSASSSVHDAS